MSARLPQAPRLARLDRKILAWAFLPTVLILGMVAWINFQAYQRVTADLVVQRNRELVRLLAGKVSSELVSLTHDLEGYAVEAATHAQDDAWLSDQRFTFPQRFPAFDGGVSIDRFSEGFQPILPSLVDLTQAESASLLAGQLEARLNSPDDSVVTDGIAFPGQDNFAIAMSVPYENGRGELVGLLFTGEAPERGFAHWLAGLNLSTRSTTVLVDGNGRVLYHTEPGEVGKDYLGFDFVAQVLAGKTGSQRVRDLGGKDRVVSYAPVVGTRWGLIIWEDWDALAGSSRATLALLVVLMATGVILPAGVVWFGVRRITRPIRELTAASTAVADGDFSRSVQARTGDEVEALAEQFNRMSRQLQASYATLEQRVEQRTRQLATVNAVAALLSGTRAIDEIVNLTLDQTMQAVGSSHGAVVLYPPDGSETPAFAVQRGISEALCAELQAMQLDADVRLRPAGELPAGGLRSKLEDEGINWLVSVPLQTSQGALGALHLGGGEPQAFLPEEVEMLVSIGRQAGLAVENARLFERSNELAVAAERNRLARELHDAVTQTLFSVSLMAEVLPRVWDSDPAAGRAQAEEIRQLTKGALGEMRSLLIELRPQALIDAEMKDLFRHLADAFRGRELIPVELAVAVVENPAPEVKVVFYRIAQEALNNVAKHACASRVEIRLEAHPGRVELSVSDDGSGFDPETTAADHLGLGIIRERAASIGASVEIRSQIGQGTTVWALWTNRT